MEDPGLEVELGLDLGRDVDGVGGGSRGGQGGAGLLKIAQVVVGFAFKQLDLGKEKKKKKRRKEFRYWKLLFIMLNPPNYTLTIRRSTCFHVNKVSLSTDYALKLWKGPSGYDVVSNKETQIHLDKNVSTVYFIVFLPELISFRSEFQIFFDKGKKSGKRADPFLSCEWWLIYLSTYLHEEIFVVQFFELLEQLRSESDGVGVLLRLVVETDQSGLQALPQERSPLVNGPLDALLKERIGKRQEIRKSAP